MLFNTYDFDDSTDSFLSDQFDVTHIDQFALYIPRQFFIYVFHFQIYFIVIIPQLIIFPNFQFQYFN